MREGQAGRDARRDREFEAFVAGAGERLLRTAALLTAEGPGDGPRARRLLTAALAHTYAHWDRSRGEDPYDRARRDLAARFARGTWYARLTRARAAGPLAALSPRERLVLVLRLHEGIGEEQTAALLGLPAERVRALGNHATSVLLRPPPARPPRARTVRSLGRTP